MTPGYAQAPAGAADLFLSYSRQDREAVLAVRERLHSAGVTTFIDLDSLVPGQAWPQALEAGISSAKGVAVFLGPTGLGTWQRREMYLALELQAEAEKRGGTFGVFPVLLAGADLAPGFLFLNTWIDLREPERWESGTTRLVQALSFGRTSRADESPLVVCPYLGLRYFREDDAAFYFGREAQIDHMFARLAGGGDRLLSVVGSSGSGKSSVIQAGLLPRLRRLRPPKSSWDFLRFTPGESPWRRAAAAVTDVLSPDLPPSARLQEVAALSDALAERGPAFSEVLSQILQRSKGTDRLLVIVDQFEELFTLTPQREVESFIRALLRATEAAGVSVLISMRADFFANAIAADRELSDRLPRATIALGPMTDSELRDAIEKPATVAGLQYEPGLVDRLMLDVKAQPGSLPLLQYALAELFVRRQERQLTLAAYREIGGVAGAIAARATALEQGLSRQEHEAMRRVLTRLVHVGDEVPTLTRRVVTRAEVGDENWHLANLLAGAENRLLVVSTDATTGTETAEVAHEALFHEWPLFQKWVSDDHTFLLWRQRMQVYLANWRASEKTGGGGALLEGVILKESGEWLRQRSWDLNAEERAYVTRSLGTSRRRKTSVRVAAGFAAALATTFGAWTAYQATDRYVMGLAERAATPLFAKIQEEESGVGCKFISALAWSGRGGSAESLVNSIQTVETKRGTQVCLAVGLALSGDTGNAKRVFNAILPLPGERSWARLARAAVAAGGIEEVLRSISAKPRERGGDMDRAVFDVLEDAIVVLTRNGSVDKGVELLERLPAERRSRLAAGVVEILIRHRRLGDLERLSGRLGDGMWQASEAFLAQGDLVRSRTYALKGTANASSVRTLMKIGETLGRTDPAGEIDLLAHADRLTRGVVNPIDQGDLLLELARRYVRLSKPELATSVLQHARHLPRQYHDSAEGSTLISGSPATHLVDVAEILLALGRREEAKATLREAESRPVEDHIMGRGRMFAKAWARVGDLDAASRAAKSEEDPDLAWINIATVMALSGQYTQARRFIESAGALRRATLERYRRSKFKRFFSRLGAFKKELYSDELDLLKALVKSGDAELPQIAVKTLELHFYSDDLLFELSKEEELVALAAAMGWKEGTNGINDAELARISMYRCADRGDWQGAVEHLKTLSWRRDADYHAGRLAERAAAISLQAATDLAGHVRRLALPPRHVAAVGQAFVGADETAVAATLYQFAIANLASVNDDGRSETFLAVAKLGAAIGEFGKSLELVAQASESSRLEGYSEILWRFGRRRHPGLLAAWSEFPDSPRGPGPSYANRRKSAGVD